MTPEAKLRAETELAARIERHGVAIQVAGRCVTAGVTDRAARRDNMRAAIRDNGLSEVICSSKDGKPRTYGAVFEWLYGESL